MSPLYRNIAIAAALVAVPAALTAAVGPDRVRSLPGRLGSRMRDWWDDDSLENNLRHLAARFEDLTDQVDLHVGPKRDRSWGIMGSILGIAILVPAAIAALSGAGKLDGLRDRAAEYWADEDAEDGGDDALQRDLSDLTDRLDSLNADLESQRDSNFDTVTRAARDADA